MLTGGRVLLIEDDVIAGGTLRLVVSYLRRFSPASLAVYLGHTRGIQHLHNVPKEVTAVYQAEDHLDWRDREADEEAFTELFGRLLS